MDLFHPEVMIQHGGIILLLCIVFAETGLFFGFFLPGDSLLFVAGILAGGIYLPVPIELLLLYVIIAATTGSAVGYAFGYWFRKHMTNRKAHELFKKKYLEITYDFYRKHGMIAFIVGRFLPIIRTFVPILAGMVRIDFKKFFIFNFVGAFIWASTMILMGHWLGNKYPFVVNHLELILVIMIVVTGLPLMISWFRNRRIFQKENM